MVAGFYIVSALHWYTSWQAITALLKANRRRHRPLMLQRSYRWSLEVLTISRPL